MSNREIKNSIKKIEIQLLKLSNRNPFLPINQNEKIEKSPFFD